jgi:hypothetical protein
MQTVIEVHVRIGGPDLGAKFLQSHQTAGSLEQSAQHLYGLSLQFQLLSPFAEFARTDVEFENIKPEDLRT